ncbi:MAG: VCBS repeat-containing protein, partial [Pleurocapsa sp. MO_192.B19]|nr:VCBS repeat-containing protein [Pleurocapsa sp. MO_192.B19]
MIFCPKFQRIICFSVIFLILIFFSVGNIFGQQAQASSYSKSILAGGLGALDNPTGKPLGGGEGYGDWVPKPPSLVTSRNELIEALNSATPGTVVYVDDSAEINLTGEWNLPINKDVTLASGRGHDGSRGALLFTQDQMAAKRPLLAVLGSGARITGLRLRGPNTNLDPPDSNNDARAIRISADNVEVDNNEIWKWARSGILAQGRQGIHIHHNYIHHQSRASLNPDCVHCGLAYGVSLSNSFALIEANIFSHNRHDIADAGLELSGYEARYNLALDVRGTGAHNFDMHGSCPYSVDSSQVECDSGGCCDDNCLYPTICTIRGKKKGGTIAGNKILIHQNTFLQNVINAVRIRGKPLDGARIYYNHFLGSQDVDDDNPNRPTADNRRDAVAQSSVPADVEMTEVAHMFVFDNMYNFDPDPAWYVWFGGYSGLILDSSQGILKFRRFEPVPLSEVRFGDFDGDGRTDIFSVTPEGEFLRWRYSPGGIGKWVNLTRSSVPLENLRFGDFDGDGKTDVFSVKKEGNSFRWRYSKAG